MADKDKDDEKKAAAGGTLTRRLSRRFSKKVLEEEEAKAAPSSPTMSSVSSASPGGSSSTPTMRRSGSMGGVQGMPPAAEVERQFVALARKLRLPVLETRTVELKWRMVSEFTAAQRAEPAELARAVRRVAKKPRATGLLGLHASLCEREAEWLAPFVKEGGAKQLMKAVARVAESAVAEDWALLGDLLRCVKELLAVDEGLEAVGTHVSPAVFLALDLSEEVAQLDLLAVVTAVVLRSGAGCAAVARAVLERKLLAQQQAQLGTLGRRSRAATADASLVPQRLSWTGLDRVVNLLVGGSDDLLLAAVMAIHAMLMRAGPDLRDTLVEALRNADLAPKLDLLIRDSKDMELRALIGVLREKNPEFRTKDVVALASQLNDSLRFMRHSHAAFGNILEHMQKLDRSDKVWMLLEGLMRSLAALPVTAGDAQGWFNEVLLASVAASGSQRDAKTEALQAQLEAAQRRMEACPHCSVAASHEPVNPVVLMRQMRVPKIGEAPESSDESSEFVDVDLDGARAVAGAVAPVTSSVVGDTPGSSKREKTPRRAKDADAVVAAALEPAPATPEALPENEAKAIAELLKLSAEKNELK